MKTIIFLLIASVLTFSCGTTIKMNVDSNYEPSPKKVEVMNLGQTIPETAILLGNISYRNSMFASSKSKAIEDVSTMVHKIGGNLIYIVSQKKNRINANVYRVESD